MKKKAKKQREFVFLFNGVPQNFMMDEDALEEKTSLPPDALEKLTAGELRAGAVRRLHDELLDEAFRQDRPEALPFLLPKNRKLPPADYDALFRRSDGSPDIRAWLLAYRRDRYSADEWEAWQQDALRRMPLPEGGSLFADGDMQLTRLDTGHRGERLGVFRLEQERDALVCGEHRFPLEKITSMAMVKANILLLTTEEGYFELRAKKACCLRKYLSVWQSGRQIQDTF